MVTIHADMRETETIAALKKFPDVNVVVGSLPSGDFRIGNDVIVERKTALDFVASIKDKRLFEQTAKMKIGFERPIIFVEGCPYSTRSNIKEEAIDGAISYLLVVEKVSVVQIISKNQFARMLVRMAIQEQGDFKEPGFRVGPGSKKPVPHALMARYILEGLPEVASGRALTILNHFGSVKAAMNASVDDYRQIPRFGDKIANSIVDAINWQATGDLTEIPD